MLFLPAPIYDDLETVKLADSLSMYMELAGADDELVRQGAGRQVAAGAGRRAGPRHHAGATWPCGKKLAEGGLAAIEASRRPDDRLARLVDEPGPQGPQDLRRQVEEPLRQAYAKIAKARFAASGTDVYPDATFTLRLAFGWSRATRSWASRCRPGPRSAGPTAAPTEHGNQEPFALPPRWLERKDRLDLDTPLNFVSTADIIGGNSGSPVVNRQGELVGIIFDGNLESLVWDFVYTDEQGRAIAVHSAAIDEALRKVYDAGPLADELGR